MINKVSGRINSLIKKIASKVQDKEELEYWRDIAPNLTKDEQQKLLEILEKENRDLEELVG